MRKILNILLNCWFPRICCACERSLRVQETGLCFYCKQYLHHTNHFQQKNNMLFLQLGYRMNLQSVQSLYFFQPQSIEQKAIHALKYRKNMEIGHFFGREIGKKLLEAAWLSDADLLVPIPIHIIKERERGYNQAQVLCEGISEVTQIEVIPLLLKKSRGKSATKGNRLQRMNEKKTSFGLNRNIPFQAKHIVLVDDVITTGATLENAYQELRKVFEGKISVVSIAHTF